MAVWDPTAKSSDVTLSGGDLIATCGIASNSAGRGDTAITTGQKRYWEVLVNDASETGVGLANASQTYNSGEYLGSNLNSISYYFDGNVYTNESVVESIGSYTDGDRICVAVDFANGKFWVRKNGGNWDNNAAHNPATNTGGYALPSGNVYPAYSLFSSQVTANFGATAFTHTPPAGFTGFSGGSTETGAGAATGTGAAAGVGTATAAAAGAATGTGAAAGTGTAQHVAQGTGAGTGTAAGVGVALHPGAGAATATGTATGVGATIAEGTGTAAATSSAAGTGETGASIGAATGAGDAQATGQAIHEGAGAAAAIGTAAGVGEALAPGTGSAAGSSSAAAVGLESTFAEGTGVAVGLGDAEAFGSQGTIGIGIAIGLSDAVGAGELFQAPPPLAFPYAVPREFCPRAIRTAGRNLSMTDESPTTGQQLVGTTSAERWEWEIELPVMEQAQGQRVASFLESLRGMRGSFEFGSPKKRRARGSARQTDNPIVTGGTEREIFVNATSILGDRKGWLKAGDMISLGPTGSITRRLYRVLRDVDLLSGVGTIDVWPRLRSLPLIPGDTVHVENPSTIFRLRNTDVEHEVDVEGWYRFPLISIVQWINAQAETPDGTAITTGQAQGESNVAGVGLSIEEGIGLAFATSQAGAVGTGATAFGTAQGIGATEGVGSSIVEGIGAASSTSTADAQGNTGDIAEGIGSAVATSTAFGVGAGGGEGNIVAEGELLTLSVDGMAWGPEGGGGSLQTGVGTAIATSTADGIAAGTAIVEWSATNKNANVVLSNGNLTATSDGTPAGTHFPGRSDVQLEIGQKRYWEISIGNSGAAFSNDAGVGICNTGQSFADNIFLGSTNAGFGFYSGGNIYHEGAPIAAAGNWSAPVVICIAVDVGNRVWFRINGADWNAAAGDDPATGAGGIDISALGACFPAYNVRNAGEVTANFAGPFDFTPPAGFAAI